MNKAAKICIVGGLVLVAAAAVVYGIFFGVKPEETSSNTPAVSPDEIIAQAGENQTEILLSDSGITVNGNGASASGNTVTITQTGNYSISGTVSEGQIYVNAGGSDSVILSLNGADISNSSESAVYIENAGYTLIKLEDGTTNRLQSGAVVEISASEDSSDSNASGGAVYARDDLGITGTGSLQVFGYINNGIHSSNNITIDSGNIEVTALNNGIKGKDSVAISGGEIFVRSGGDGIKSDDTTGEGYGVIKISGGNISIESDSDGIQAETELEITGGDFSIISGGGSENAFSIPGNGGFGSFDGNNGRGRFGGFDGDNGDIPSMPENGGRGRENFDGKRKFGEEENFSGMDLGNSEVVSENVGSMPGNNDMDGSFGGGRMPSDGGTPPDIPDGSEGGFGNFGGFGGFGNRGENFDMDDGSTVSTKGIKCGGTIRISGGSFSIDSYDDAVHSNNSIYITGGNFNIASGDDGIHADKELTVESGTICIRRSYEGLEGNQIHLNGGSIDVTASDDGINAYGGQNNFGGAGGSSKTTEETPMLYFSGADVVVNASGDGIDSNGSIFVESGTIIVNGPVDSANGAIDSGSENGGKCVISGGTILAIGSSGMDEGFSSESSQCSFRQRLETALSAGSEITISDSSGNVLFRHTAVKSASSVVFSCPDLKTGEKYILSIDGQETEIEQSSVSVSSGESFGGGMGRTPGRSRW